jgi:hypothetical protein
MVSTERNSDPEAVAATEKKVNIKISRDWFTGYQTKWPPQAPTTDMAPNCCALKVYCMSSLHGGKTQHDNATVERYTK